MSAAPSWDKLEVPQDVLDSIQGVLNVDERLLWATKPLFAGYVQEQIRLYPIYLFFAIGLAAGGWYFYSWAEGAGILWNFRPLVLLVIIGMMALSLIFVPILWTIRLGRCWYALTSQRLLVCTPQLLILLPRVRSLEAPPVRLKCIWTWLPDRTGDIYFGDSNFRIMERVPHAEEVVALINRTLNQATVESPEDP